MSDFLSFDEYMALSLDGKSQLLETSYKAHKDIIRSYFTDENEGVVFAGGWTAPVLVVPYGTQMPNEEELLELGRKYNSAVFSFSHGPSIDDLSSRPSPRKQQADIKLAA